jgi:hypothetical protein
MLFLIAFVTIFPAVVALILRANYYKVVPLLAAFNLIIAWFAHFFINTLLTRWCEVPDLTTSCHPGAGLYAVISVLNILFAAFLWFLAFNPTSKPAKKRSKLTDNPLANLRIQNDITMRKVLYFVGWAIVLIFTILAIGMAALFSRF